MLRHQKVTIILGTVTLALCATWAVWPDASEGPDPENAPGVAQGRGRLRSRAGSNAASPGTALGTRWAPSSPRPLRTAASETPGDDEQSAAVDTDALPRGEAAVDVHEQFLAQRLEQEGRDGEWSAETERAIHDAIAQQDFAGASVLEATCGATLCRTQIQLDDEPAHERFLEHAPVTVPFATNGMIRTVGDPEHPRVVVYFARDGHTI